jgi:hypothetical protein
MTFTSAQNSSVYPDIRWYLVSVPYDIMQWFLKHLTTERSYAYGFAAILWAIDIRVQ